MNMTTAEHNSRRYTESQILCGLRELWPWIAGIDVPFFSGTRIIEYMEDDGLLDEIDFGDLFKCVEKFFGFHCATSDWTDFFGFDLAKANHAKWKAKVTPNLTFGALARFIVERTEEISLGSVTVLGSECKP